MAKRIVVRNPDGSVVQVIPAYHDAIFGVRPGRTEDDVLADVIKKDVPLGATYVVVEESSLPHRGSLRGAWRFDRVVGVRVDLTVARSIKLEQIRVARNEKLKTTDGEMLRAIDIGDAVTQANLKTFRQELRDLPLHAGAALSALQSPEAVDGYWPAELREEVTTKRG